MDGTGLERDKPWRPADHPRPAPSWDEAGRAAREAREADLNPPARGGAPDAED